MQENPQISAMSSNKVSADQMPAVNGGSTERGSGSEEKGVFSPSPRSAGALSPGRVLQDKIVQIVTEIRQLNLCVGNVEWSVTDFEDRFHSLKNSLQDQKRRLEGHLNNYNRSLEDQNTQLEDLKSQISGLVERKKNEGLLVKLVDSTHKCGEPSVDEALDLLPAAEKLGMNNLMKNLKSVLMNGLAVANCIDIFQLASQYLLQDLIVLSNITICKNFHEVSKTCASFCKLSLKDLSVLVFSDSVHATEEEIFKAIELWIEAEKPERRQLISQLLPAIRVRRCSLKFLTEVERHYLVQEDPVFLTAARDRIQKLSSRGLNQVSSSAKGFPRGTSKQVLIGGYKKADTEDTVESDEIFSLHQKILDTPRIVGVHEKPYLAQEVQMFTNGETKRFQFQKLSSCGLNQDSHGSCAVSSLSNAVAGQFAVSLDGQSIIHLTSSDTDDDEACAVDSV